MTTRMSRTIKMAMSMLCVLVSGCENYEEHSVFVRVSSRLEHGWFVDKVTRAFASGWSEIYPINWTGSPVIGVGAKKTVYDYWTVGSGTPIPGPGGNLIVHANILGPDLYDAFVFEMPAGVTFETVIFYVPFPGQMPPAGEMPVLSEGLFCSDAMMSSCTKWSEAVELGLLECVDELGVVLPSSHCIGRPPYVRWYARDASNFPIASRGL
jgi:hypothetical protein